MRYSVLFIFLFFSSYIFGQTSYSLVSTNKLWFVSSPQINGYPYQTKIFRFQDDTLINGFLYDFVYSGEDSINDNTTLDTSLSVIGYIREDSLKRVFFMDTMGHEGLIYNFFVNVNDTVEIFNANLFPDQDTVKFIVTDIDSIYIYDNYRKQIHLQHSGSSMEDIWIEGIGSLNGILESGRCIIGGWEPSLHCFIEDHILKYENDNYTGDCFYTYTSIQNLYKDNNSSILISPNPSFFGFTVTFPENTESTQLTISSITGQIIKIISLNKGQNTYQFTEKLPAGIYFVGVDSDKGTVVKKLVVE